MSTKYGSLGTEFEELLLGQDFSGSNKTLLADLTGSSS